MALVLVPVLRVYTAGLGTPRDSGNSLSWQKLQLEERIYTKLDNNLGAIVPSKQYILDVLITINLPKKPNFTATNPTAKKQIKFTNLKADKNVPKDYIVFSKLGLEAPLVNDIKKEKKSEFEHLWQYDNLCT